MHDLRHLKQYPIMSLSQIYYKFKSAKDYDTLTFDGLGITVFDAKKEILTAKKLKGNDFDIVISHAESGEGKLNVYLGDGFFAC